MLASHKRTPRQFAAAEALCSHTYSRHRSKTYVDITPLVKRIVALHLRCRVGRSVLAAARHHPRTALVV